MSQANAATKPKGPLIYRQSIWTRVTHWVWAICLFFLLLTGLQIFNAHPALYIGQQSGFEFENSVFKIGAVNTDAGPRGQTTVLGQNFDSTALGLGMSGNAERPVYTGFPGGVTIPSYRDLGTGRVVHFFFGWVFVATMLIWFRRSSSGLSPASSTGISAAISCRGLLTLQVCPRMWWTTRPCASSMDGPMGRCKSWLISGCFSSCFR